MEIQNLSWTEYSKRNNNSLLPQSIRGIIVGKSGCGKTNLLLNLLLTPGWLDYDKLFVFGKSLFQPEYKIIKEAFEYGIHKEQILKLFKNRDAIGDISPSLLLEELAKVNNSKSSIVCQFYDNVSDVPDPRELNSFDKNLMIFDDLLLEKQNKCEDYYVRGRHSNIDSIYLAQSYFKLPRQTIRENANFICLFKQDAKNINHIFHDHVSMDMEKEEFRVFCKKCWEQPYGFVVIDNSSNKNNGKYRCGFDSFYFPKNGS